MSKIDNGWIGVGLLMLNSPVLPNNLAPVLCERGGSKPGNFRVGLYITN